MSENNEDIRVRVLIACEDEGERAAVMFSEIYRNAFTVEYNNSLLDFETAMEYAQKNKMTHMLYFLDGVNLKLVSLADELGGYTLDVTVDDLKNALSQKN